MKSKKFWSEVFRLLRMCEQWGIILCSVYLPGLPKVEPDALSQKRQVKGWAILLGIASSLFARWGHPQINLFADSSNAVVYSFLSVRKGNKEAME